MWRWMLNPGLAFNELILFLLYPVWFPIYKIWHKKLWERDGAFIVEAPKKN
jgi:hypothetical protein